MLDKEIKKELLIMTENNFVKTIASLKSVEEKIEALKTEVTTIKDQCDIYRRQINYLTEQGRERL